MVVPSARAAAWTPTVTTVAWCVAATASHTRATLTEYSNHASLEKISIECIEEDVEVRKGGCNGDWMDDKRKGETSH